MTNAHLSAGGDAVHLFGGARLVAVATVDDPAQAESMGRALLAGGVRCVEITLRTASAVEAIRRLSQIDDLFVGAGTVLSPEEARAAAAAGARFAVAPGLNEEVVSAAHELDLPFVPGVATATEVDRARTLGLRVLKVFPATQLGGPGFLRALSAPYPDVRFVPTGGIGPETVAEYLAVPSVLSVGGGWLVESGLLREGRFDEVERLAREATRITS